VSGGAMAILIRRETHWQCGLLAAKGHGNELLRDGAAPLRAVPNAGVSNPSDRIGAYVRDRFCITERSLRPI